jgi:hypothetical protein
MRIIGRHQSPRSSPGSRRSPLPEAGTAVRLRLAVPSEAKEDLIVELPSTVETVEEAVTTSDRMSLLISATDVEFLPYPPDLSIEHLLIWIAAEGQMEMPVLLCGLDDPRWRLIATGPVRRVQRRNYVRVPVSLPAVVLSLDPPGDGEDGEGPDAVASGGEDGEGRADGTGDGSGSGRDGDEPAGDAKPPQWQATVLDLGEGGVRCVVRGAPPAPGMRIVVLLGADSVLECTGVVIRHLQPNDDDTEFTTLAIRFDDPEKHGDAIRRMVFAEQLRLRKNRLETSRN